MIGINSRFNNLFLIILLIITVPSMLLAEDPDELYRKGLFAEAEEAYRKADMDNPRDIRYRYNRGCAAYKNEDYKAAVAAFSSVLRRAKDKDILYRTFFNLGNIAFIQGDFQSAIESYKGALTQNPKSDDAKYNLELALKKLKEEKNNRDKQEQTGKDGDESKQEKRGSENDKSGKDKGEQNKSDRGERREQENGDGREDNKMQGLTDGLNKAGPLNEDQSDEVAPNAQSVLDKRKAEALLDNINEDRGKILKFQIPKGKRDGVKSGKAW